MVDLVGTCPKDFWSEWIAEGDAAGDRCTGEEWGWWTLHRAIRLIQPGDRFYVVAHGRLRGYAPVTRVHLSPDGRGGAICRRGDAIACTIGAPIAGFRGLKQRWWSRADEVPFADWKAADVSSPGAPRFPALPSLRASAAPDNPGGGHVNGSAARASDFCQVGRPSLNARSGGAPA